MVYKVSYKALILLAGIGLLSACAHVKPGRPVEPMLLTAPDVTQPQGPSAEELGAQEQQKKIKYYLFNALEALEGGRLMRPKHDNAYDWFSQVLWLDGTHAEAHRGMREIGAAYLRLAEQAYQVDNRARAELMLQRAQWVSASPEAVAALKAKYPTPPKANNEFRLAVNELNQKSDELVARLADLAEQAKSLPSRLLIVARSDREGRWIYKQMRDSVEGYRLRGNIEVGHRPKIILIDMPENKVAANNNE